MTKEYKRYRPPTECLCFVLDTIFMRYVFSVLPAGFFKHIQHMPQLLVGLGNPWPSPKSSRHNLGSLVLEAMAEELCLHWEWRWACWSWTAGEGQLVLTIPGSFYNFSGWAVQRVLQTLGFDPDDVVLLHDDIDLESFVWATIRSENDGGNRGVRSVLQAIGAVRRLRLGVGRPASRSPASVAAYVLGCLEPTLLQRWQTAAAAGEVLDILRSCDGKKRGRLS